MSHQERDLLELKTDCFRKGESCNAFIWQEISMIQGIIDYETLLSCYC